MLAVITPWHYLGFALFVALMLAIDLGVFHRKAHVVGLREAGTWVAVWVSLALTFNALVFLWMGTEKGLEFLTGYIIEWSLSVDNVFVWLVLFSYFAVPPQYRHRVLFLGILGAIVFRGLFIAAGVTLLKMFHWVVYLFGAFLIFTGIRLALRREEEVHPERNPVVRLARRFLPLVPEYHGQSFIVRRHGRWMATPLVLVLVAVEATDIVFAVDSVPAILAITRDPFIVWTSNVFAILGLRALFFLVAGALYRFRYLNVGLALILCFVGVKMLLSDVYKIPTAFSLGVVVTILLGTVLASLYKEAKVRAPASLQSPAPHASGSDPPEKA